MKRFFVFISLVIVSLAYADYVEIKEAGGRVGYRTYSPNLYVCYDKRIKVISDGEMYLLYKGCTRENTRCRNVGKVHFGKYPSNRAAANALWRCRNSRPRFVD